MKLLSHLVPGVGCPPGSVMATFTLCSCGLSSVCIWAEIRREEKVSGSLLIGALSPSQGLHPQDLC